MTYKIIIALIIAAPLGIISGFVLKALWVGIFLWFFCTVISAFIINLICFKKEDSLIGGLSFSAFNGFSAFLALTSSFSSHANSSDIVLALLLGFAVIGYSLGIYLVVFLCLFAIKSIFMKHKNK